MPIQPPSENRAEGTQQHLARTSPTADRRRKRSADFQSAVSRISNPPVARSLRAPGFVEPSADWKSATQQTASRLSIPGVRTCRAACRLEVGDTADWKSALRRWL